MEAEYDGRRISDDFKVRIAATASGRPPLLIEIGGRTESIAKKFRINSLDLHKNRDGTACVCVKQVEKLKFPPSSSLLHFIEELAVPYLFGLVRYEQTGKWPWQDYSHGFLGFLEFYADRAPGTGMDDFGRLRRNRWSFSKRTQLETNPEAPTKKTERKTGLSMRVWQTDRKLS